MDLQDRRSLRALRRRLLDWYDGQGRDLPWRGRDVYGVWVSEAMLQQTRVDVALPYYERWMARWPDVHSLAVAPEEDVLAAWAGLGYYARARNLHAAAKEVARTGWPRDLAGWRRLPGVGPYTAAAVTSIALGQANACVDGNVARVLARWTLEREALQASGVARRLATHAQRVLDPTRPGDWNQAMMDLGATVCTPRSPRCGACPVADACGAHAAGLAASIPAARRRAAPRPEDRHVAVVRDRGRVLLVRPGAGLLRGLWGLPSAKEARALTAAVREQTGIAVRLARQAGAGAGPHATTVHRFSHRTWRMQVWLARPARANARPAEERDATWMPLGRLGQAAVPAATRIALRAAGIAIPARGKAAPRRGAAPA